MGNERKKCAENIIFPFFIQYAAIDGNELWFIDSMNCGLCYVDLSEGLIKAIYKIPDTRLFGECKYHEIKIVKNKIVLFPYMARDILIFYKEQEEFKRIDLNIQDIQEGPFLNANYLYGDMLFVFMLSLQRNVVIDLIKEKIIKSVDFPLEVDSEKAYNKIQFSENCAYIQNTRTCWMLKYDMQRQIFEQQKMEDDSWQLMDGEGACPYFFGDCGNLAKWEWGHDAPQVVAQLPTDFKYYVFENDMLQWESYQESKCRKDFPQQFYDDGCAIWFIPFSSEELICIDKKTYKIRKMTLNGEEEKEARPRISWGKYFLCADVHRNFLWIYSLKRCLIYKIDVEAFTYEEVKIYISRRDFCARIGDYFERKKIIVENMHMGLSVLLEYVKTLG